MHGIWKSSNGEFFNNDNGKPPSNFPDGEIIKIPPPPIALNPRNTNNDKWIFLAVLGQMIKIKTAGNLSAQQIKMLESILTDLRLNFVDEKKKDSIS